MTVLHDPSDPTLAAFAAGTLDEGCAVVVATHLAGCPVCRKAVRFFEQLRGAILQDRKPAPMAADALKQALAAIAADQAPAQTSARDGDRIEIPAPLSLYPLGKWRWIGRGVHWRSVEVPSEQGTRVFMLKAAPGTRIPHHGHAGIEWTCILQGAFRHQYGVYGAGDFDEADESVDHQVRIEDGDECICLVAMRGQIRLKGWLGRAIQPFVRI